MLKLCYIKQDCFACSKLKRVDVYDVNLKN